jgi:hypothetical protein
MRLQTASKAWASLSHGRKKQRPSPTRLFLDHWQPYGTRDLTMESKPFLCGWGTRCRSSSHHSISFASAVGMWPSRLQRWSRACHTSRAKTHPTARWSAVSRSCSHKGQDVCELIPRRRIRSAIQRRHCMASQMWILHLPGAHVFQIVLPHGNNGRPAWKALYAELAEYWPVGVHLQTTLSGLLFSSTFWRASTRSINCTTAWIVNGPVMSRIHRLSCNASATVLVCLAEASTASVAVHQARHPPRILSCVRHQLQCELTLQHGTRYGAL